MHKKKIIGIELKQNQLSIIYSMSNTSFFFFSLKLHRKDKTVIFQKLQKSEYYTLTQAQSVLICYSTMRL